jgi:L-ascorbate metabolism protein UlaG (beta-lactamase superfamily)
MKKILFTLISLVMALMACKEGPKKDAITDISAESEDVSEPVAELRIIPIEHATAVLEWGDTTIYVDPVGGAAAFEGQKPPDLILITDIHGDHFNMETLEELDTEKAKIMVPQEVADKMPDTFAPQIDVLNNGDSKERYGIRVEAVPMYNLREEAKQFHPRGRGNGYVLEMGDERVYFSGDTEDIPEMRSLQNIDKAFICMNLPYTMTVESAAEAVLAFQPAQIYPYHYRGNPDVSDVSEFASLIKAGNSDIEVVQLDWYPDEAY